MKKKIYTNGLKNIAKTNNEERNVLPVTEIYQKVKHIKSGICTKGKKNQENREFRNSDLYVRA